MAEEGDEEDEEDCDEDGEALGEMVTEFASVRSTTVKRAAPFLCEVLP